MDLNDSKGQATPVHVCLPVSANGTKPFTCIEQATPVCVRISVSIIPCADMDGKVLDPFNDGHRWWKRHTDVISLLLVYNLAK